jgi:hypothetical protein
MGVTIQRATSVVEVSGPPGEPLPVPAEPPPPGQAELERMAILLAALERDRRRLRAEGFDD